RIVATIQAADRRPRERDLIALYGLTPRERDVLRFALRGEPTKRIAAALEISMHTVEAHLGSACEKVGVRGRRALLAKLLADGYSTAPRGGASDVVRPPA